MAQIYNSNLSKELVQGARIQQVNDRVPNILGDVVIPTMEVNPKLLRNINIVRSVAARTTTGSTVGYTTPTDREFYLTSVIVGYAKDAVCDSATGSYDLSVVIDGATQYIYRMPIVTLTAATEHISLSFPSPIKLDKGTTISFSGTFTVGLCSRNIGVTGFTIDNSNA